MCVAHNFSIIEKLWKSGITGICFDSFHDGFVTLNVSLSKRGRSLCLSLVLAVRPLSPTKLQERGQIEGLPCSSRCQSGLIGGPRETRRRQIASRNERKRGGVHFTGHLRKEASRRHLGQFPFWESTR